MAKKMSYDFLNCAKEMPPLRHTIPGTQYAIGLSNVARWIANQPEVLQKVFDMARQKGMIIYDKETGMWKGADYDEIMGDEI